MISTNESLNRRFSKLITSLKLWKFLPTARFIKWLKTKPQWFLWGVSKLQTGSEKYELEVFAKQLSKDSIFIDIGANIGLYTQTAAKKMDVKGKIIAFEPDPVNFRFLNLNLKNLKSKALIRTENLALSSKKGRTTLYSDPINPGNNSFSVKNLYEKGAGVKVNTIKLDDYLKKNRISHADVIKIDVQGAEALVLAGAKNLLKQKHLKIMIEFWPKAIESVGGSPHKMIYELAGNGFQFYVVDKKSNSTYRSTPQEILKEASTWKDYTDYTNLLLTK